MTELSSSDVINKWLPICSTCYELRIIPESNQCTSQEVSKVHGKFYWHGKKAGPHLTFKIRVEGGQQRGQGVPSCLQVVAGGMLEDI